MVEKGRVVRNREDWLIQRQAGTGLEIRRIGVSELVWSPGLHWTVIEVTYYP